MAELQQKYPLDYRIGGDTIDDFAQKYIKEIPRIYQFLNNARGLNSEGPEQVDPTKYQLKAEDDKLYIRNKENTDWVYLGEIKPCFGFTPSVDTRLLNEEDIASKPGEAGKILVTNEAGLLEVSITGNAAKIGEKTIQINSLSDGEILVYRSSTGSFVNESKGTIGLGKALTITYDKQSLGTYSGNNETTIEVKPPTMIGATDEEDGKEGLSPAPTSSDIEKFLSGRGIYEYAGINLLQRNKDYTVGDIAYSPLLPSWARLECITAGTTGAEEPELLSAPPMDNSKIGTYITDGTVVWVVDDIRDGTPIGGVRGSLYLPKGYIKANGATVNRADYPRLVKFIETNNLWTDEVEGNLGLFGKGDGSTTFVVPNYVGRMVTYKDTGAGQTIAAGLPNITGAFYMDSYAKTQGTVNGCFTYHDGSFKGLSGANLYGSGTISIDASLSNPIYGASDTVQPPAISLIPVIRY